MNTVARSFVPHWQRLVAVLESLQPLALLAARLTVAQAFFLSGLTKLRDWDTTLALVHRRIPRPLLSPELAAVMGTGGELVLPVLLVLGLGGRFAAAGLSVVNVVAVLSLAEIAPAALQQHVFWGSLLLAVLLWGPGRWSLDGGRTRPDGLLQRLGRQRAHQRLPAVGGGRGQCAPRHAAGARQAHRHRPRPSSACAPKRPPAASGRHGRPGVDQRRELPDHEARRPAVRALCRSAAELPATSTRGQADHARRFLRTGGRYGSALGHGAAHLLCRPQALPCRRSRWPSCRLGAPQSGAVHLPKPPQFHGTTFVKQVLLETHPDRAALARPLQRSRFAAADRAAVACAGCAAPAAVACGAAVPGQPHGDAPDGGRWRADR
jgi:putative oxidoreductase